MTKPTAKTLFEYRFFKGDDLIARVQVRGGGSVKLDRTLYPYDRWELHQLDPVKSGHVSDDKASPGGDS